MEAVLRITRRHSPDTRRVEFCVTVPTERAGEVETALFRLLSPQGKVLVLANERGEEIVPVPEASPGEVLKGFRLRDGLTQRQLAQQLGIAQHHVSEMEGGKRVISMKMAERFALFFQEPSYKIFL